MTPEQPPAGPRPEQPPTGPPKVGVRAALVDHQVVLAPWAWMAAADTAAVVGHYTADGFGWAAVTAAGVSAVGASWAKWRTRDGRLSKRVKTARTRRAIKKNANVAIAAGTLWQFTATLWTPWGPYGAVQLALVGGGLAVAAPHLWRNRRSEPEEPRSLLPAVPLPIEAPRVDGRLAAFRDRFCSSGALRDARLHGIEAIEGGFRFQIELALAYGGTFRDLKYLEEQIAALYDVPLDQASVEPSETRSARRGVVTVLTETRAHERDEPWDGTSTYNPKTGAFVLGRFADGTSSRWQLHIPGSGAACGLCAGVQGTGKTGTLNVIIAEASQAKLCVACAAQTECEECTARRICAVWVGDAQRQGMSVWRGRADLSAWGPRSCVRMLALLHAAMRIRADEMGRERWVDHLGRENFGRGWFDPSPGRPILLSIIDEWPIIEGDPELSSFAIPLVEDIGREGRKVGCGIILGTQNVQVEEIGGAGVRDAVTAHNVVCHRCGAGATAAKRMLSLEGNPADLPPIHGASYLKGIDQRSGIVQRTKHLPEILKPGQSGIDVRAIADLIATDPITYDPAVVRAITAMGYTGPGMVLDDDDPWDLSSLLAGAEAPLQEPAGQPHAAPSVGPVSRRDVDAVRAALSASAAADVFDLMEATQLSALDVTRGIDALITEGFARQESDGRYATC